VGIVLVCGTGYATITTPTETTISKDGSWVDTGTASPAAPHSVRTSQGRHCCSSTCSYHHVDIAALLRAPDPEATDAETEDLVYIYNVNNVCLIIYYLNMSNVKRIK